MTKLSSSLSTIITHKNTKLKTLNTKSKSRIVRNNCSSTLYDRSKIILNTKASLMDFKTRLYGSPVFNLWDTRIP